MNLFSDKQMIAVVIGVTLALFLYTNGSGFNIFCCNRCKKKLPCCKMMNENKMYQGSF